MPQSDESVTVSVTVIRTGGIAGMKRRWHAEPHGEETSAWITLIDRCPWDEDVPGLRGADRFVWSITVDVGTAERRTDVPDQALTGAWRELVDAVRDWGDGAAGKPEESGADR